jgi:hypothetical protein
MQPENARTKWSRGREGKEEEEEEEEERGTFGLHVLRLHLLTHPYFPGEEWPLCLWSG